MKQLFLHFAIVSSSIFGGNLSAQSISIPHDTITATITTDDQKFYNKITNTASSAITVTWEIIEHDFPSDWQSSLAICDNKLCYSGASLFDGVAEITDPIPVGTQGEFYVWPILSSATPGTHFIKIRMTVPLEAKDSWYIFTKNATSGVVRVDLADNRIAIYPNPTNNEVTIFHDKSLNVSRILLTGITGNIIKTASTIDEVSHISVGDLPAGMYFIQFTDTNNTAIKTSKLYRN